MTCVNLKEDVLVTDRGVMHLAHGCKRLTALDLTGCSAVGDPPLMSLCDGQLNPGLRTLRRPGRSQTQVPPPPTLGQNSFLIRPCKVCHQLKLSSTST